MVIMQSLIKNIMQKKLIIKYRTVSVANKELKTNSTFPPILIFIYGGKSDNYRLDVILTIYYIFIYV